MTFNLVALPGDGIGPEIMAGTLEILDVLATKFNFDCHVDNYKIGGWGWDINVSQNRKQEDFHDEK